MTLPPCPWCLGERVYDPEVWPETEHGCAECGVMLGLQLEPRPPASCPLSTLDATD